MLTVGLSACGYSWAHLVVRSHETTLKYPSRFRWLLLARSESSHKRIFVVVSNNALFPILLAGNGVGARTSKVEIVLGLTESRSPDRVRLGGSDHTIEHSDLNGDFLLLSTECTGSELALLKLLIRPIPVSANDRSP